MATLKELRNRIKSVQSTKKITSAMKMIAAAKLRRAQDRVNQSTPYADLMEDMICSLAEKGRTFETPPALLVGTGQTRKKLYIIITSDRGLCGSFNANVVRHIEGSLREATQDGGVLSILCIGLRGRDAVKSLGYGDNILETFKAPARPDFHYVRPIAQKLLGLFNEGGFDECTMVYNKFISVISQKITTHKLVPYTPLMHRPVHKDDDTKIHAIYKYEPDEQTVLEELLPKNFAVQLFRAVIENAASEHGARMTAMDSATRNANEMIDKLNLVYNRTRQAQVTKELIEIISGAEAL